MMDIQLSKKIDKDALKKLCAKFCNINIDRVMITDEIDQILNVANRDEFIWINMYHQAYGDFHYIIEIFEPENEFGSYLDFAKVIAQKTYQSVLSDFNRKLEYSEWILIDKNRNEHLVEEDLDAIYPDNEDGITLDSKFKYLLNKN